MEKILVTGALGQIGSELVIELRKRYGNEAVIASDIQKNDGAVCNTGPFEIIDVTNSKKLLEVTKKYQVDTVMHLAALLSARAEENPLFAWNLNTGGLINALEVAREVGAKLFTPSSIGAFGPSTPKRNTPQVTIQRPTTMYGVNKVAGELLCDYYFHKYGVDTRGVRFPGLISYVSPPGGGTTDYAVDIYCQAIAKGEFISNIAEDTYMDMMYMPDAVTAIIELMEADSRRLIHRNAYNITAMSVTPKMIAAAIRKHLPTFAINYAVDPTLQRIANSWPDGIDSAKAREEWNFQVAYDLERTTEDMLYQLGRK